MAGVVRVAFVAHAQQTRLCVLPALMHVHVFMRTKPQIDGVDLSQCLVDAMV